MQVRFLNGDGTVSTIPNVKWHPEYTQDWGAGLGERHFPAGLWIRKSEVLAHYESVNMDRRSIAMPERDISAVIEDIVCAEAEVEIYDDVSNEEPWRHNGTLVKKVSYGRDDRLSNERA